MTSTSSAPGGAAAVDGGGETAAQVDTAAELRARLALLAPFGGQLRVPDQRTGIVPRPELVSRLTAADAPPVVILSAATGYGKSCLLAEWAAVDPRAFAWVSITEVDDNGLTLLAYIARALDATEPLDLTTLAALTRPGADLTTTQLPRLGAALQDRTTGVVLVLDDVHLLRSTACAQVLAVLAQHVPPGSQLVLAGRSEPPVLVGRIRAQGRLLMLTDVDLGLTASEGTALVRAAGVDLRPEALDTLLERADGWPAGLYLATIAVRGGRDVDRAAKDFSGDDRLVAELLRDEVLPTLSAATADFLVQTSVLDRMSGSLCDAVLQQSGSSERLEKISQSNLFLIPLDRTGGWYRFHHLFRDLLRAELGRRDPTLERALHMRASTWFEAHGDVDPAIRHARSAGNLSRAAALIWGHTAFYVTTGRADVVQQWLDLFTVEEQVDRPELALAAAWRGVASRDIGQTDFWLAAAERADDDVVLADGRSARSAAALLRAAVGRRGLTQIADDAALAYELDIPGSPFRSTARYVEGGARRLLGDETLARERLVDATHLAGPTAPTVMSGALTQLALLDLDHDWAAAERSIVEARAIVERLDLRDQPTQVMAYALSALARARRGDSGGAVRDRMQARGLLANFGDVAQWLAIEARIVLGRMSLLLGDVATARLLLHEAGSLLERYPDSGSLPDKLEYARKGIDDVNSSAGTIAAPLTTAELRVLRYLPTHLTLAAIAEELFVSRNTAKTHAISVYRKLGVSSRQAAVEQARMLGLLDDDR